MEQNHIHWCDSHVKTKNRSAERLKEKFRRLWQYFLFQRAVVQITWTLNMEVSITAIVSIPVTIDANYFICKINCTSVFLNKAHQLSNVRKVISTRNLFISMPSSINISPTRVHIFIDQYFSNVGLHQIVDHNHRNIKDRIYFIFNCN